MAAKPNLHQDELRLLYQVTVSDLTYFKTQQWSVTNYSVLLYAAIVAISQLIKPLQSIERIVLCFLALLVMCAALTVLYKLQDSIRVRQTRLAEVRRQFTDEFHIAWAAGDKGAEYVHSIFFLGITVLIGASSVVWLIGWRL